MNMLAKNENREMGQIRSFDGLMRAMMDHMGLTNARFFDPVFDSPFTSRLQIEVGEKAVEAKLPCAGCKPSDFEVEVVGDLLNVKVHRSQENKCGGKKHCISRERSFEEFSESVELPVAVKGAETKASYRNGVLELSIPIEKAVRPASHSIQVQ